MPQLLLPRPSSAAATPKSRRYGYNPVHDGVGESDSGGSEDDDGCGNRSSMLTAVPGDSSHRPPLGDDSVVSTGEHSGASSSSGTSSDAAGGSSGSAGSFSGLVRSLLLPIYAPALCQTVALSLAVPLVPLFTLGNLGAGPSAFGVVIAAQGLGRTAANIPAGKLSSVFGDRTTILAGLFLQVHLPTLRFFSTFGIASYFLLNDASAGTKTIAALLFCRPSGLSCGPALAALISASRAAACFSS